MNARIFGMVVTALLVLTGCSPPDSSPTAPGRAAMKKVSTGAPVAFVNRVWVVAESEQVAPGELRVFLSEGTLVMASPYATPAFGTWRYHDGHLTITEEGREYKVEMLELSENAFRIQIHGPGEPVGIRFKPAGQLPVPKISSAQSEGR